MILRPATFADEKLLLEWRNDPTVRAASGHTGFVTPEQHHAHLAKVFADPEYWLFIGEVDGVPVGKGHIERAYKAISPRMDTGMVGYSIVSEHRRKGYGVQIATLLVNEVKAKGFMQAGARIRRDNMCSIKVATRAGVHTIELF